ncbi:MAG: DUF748 domain-containing protein [Acidovorax sp.]|uniref:DUF748 domain-containing protein n=1 Tax=Acidovorax sp. TaxID=1872122 RepID=UPI002614539F|nr:DUF748 domain-containing protein [Acidovorax sp.]MDH4427833.1 DUF748 domain-containing protein [Acidovorax sp.]
MLPSLRPISLATLRAHRWARPALRTLGGLIGLWLLAWLAVPPLVKSQLERVASDKLGRAVTVGAVDFRPWSLELALNDVTVAGADPSGLPQLTIGRIYADGELQSLLRLAPVVDAFTVDRPMLRLRHLGGGRYDVDDILAKLAAQPQDDAGKSPARLALYNLALTDGSVDYTDDSVAGGKAHEVRELALRLPFLSTLKAPHEIRVEPHLSFALNGSRFDSSAASTPFAQTGRSEATIRWEGLDLAPYLPYLPASLPVKVHSATLDMDVKVAFEQNPRMAVKLSGAVNARGVRLTDRQDSDLLSYESLKIDMADVRPLEQVVHLNQVELTAPVVTLARNAAGQLNVAQLATGTSTTPSTPTSQPVAVADPASAPQAPPARPAAAPATPWSVRLAHAAVRGGTVRWSDQAVRPAAALQASHVALELADLALPMDKPFTFKGALKLQEGGLSFAGEASERKASVNASLQTLSLQLASPYLAQVLEPAVSGQLTGDWGLQWENSAKTAVPGKAVQPPASGITLTAGPLALEQFALRQGKTTLASVGRLAVDGVRVQLDERTATLGHVAVVQPQVNVERAADGRWMFERWAKATPAASPDGAATAAATPAAEAASTPSAAPWKVRVADFALERGTVAFADQAQPRPVALEMSGLQVAATDWASDGSQPGALQLSARAAVPVPAGRTAAAPGKLDFKGTVAMEPLALQGRLDLARLPVHALDGYLASQLSIELLRADLGFQGQLALSQSAQGTSLRLAGDAVVDALRADSTAASTPKTEAQVGRELVSWKSLNLRGLSVATAPGTAPRVEIKETSVIDLFARVTVNEAGRINLSDIATPPAQVQALSQLRAAEAEARAATGKGTPPAAAASAPGSASASASASASTTTSAVPVTAAAPDPLAPVVVSGPISLVNAQVIFSDFFIQPNYSADLTQLTGRLAAFSSQANAGDPVLADLELRGRAEDSASIEITGKLNPLARPLALDITGRLRDLELPPLSPYAVRYAGHGIERGKLNMDVNYTVLPSGQLTASNRLVLHQLTFGEPVPGAPGSLPVKLAVALLADRNGVIDLDLPISGSLNDPQFRLGPVIGRIIVNLIGKALTSPFSLLASALGGSGTELSQVPFAPGSAALTPEAQGSLAKVVAALTDRPALKLTVTGTASLKEEREGLQRESLRQRVLAEKRRANPADTSPVSDTEYPTLLKEVYRRADMAKPRNLVGLARELTTAEMEALLMASQPATEAMAAELAHDRGQAVRAYLVAQKLPPERLFVAAPKANAMPEQWTPRADLSLKAE